jgi:curved DNA-binding protein CbpA
MSDSPRSKDDPLHVLGLPRHATEQEIRKRYLELVREFPPEREPERFQQIHAAYKAAEDPLLLAQRFLRVDEDPPPNWSEVLEQQKKTPPRLSVNMLLSLGNQTSVSATPLSSQPTSGASDD